MNSAITRIFGGKFRTTLRVPGQRDSAVLEDWRSLRLDIQVRYYAFSVLLRDYYLHGLQRDQVNSISDALHFLSHPQQVQVSSVTKGGVTVDATQQSLVETLPPILVLHLKRFLYDTSAKGVVKIGKQIAFGPELDFPVGEKQA